VRVGEALRARGGAGSGAGRLSGPSAGSGLSARS
jgi:hypothetical protein